MSVQQLQYLTKTIFGTPVEVLPEENSFSEMFKFKQAEKTGDKYVVPVEMAREQGFTYNSDHSGFPLNPHQDSNWQRAELEGCEVLGRAVVPYGHMAKMSTSNGDSRSSYKQAMGQTIQSLMVSGEARREIALMYGPGGVAATTGTNLGVPAGAVVASAPVPGSATESFFTLTLTRGTWADGMWPLLINARFDFTAVGGATPGAPINASVGNIGLKLIGVDQSRCRLTFSGITADVAAVIISIGTVAPLPVVAPVAGGSVLNFFGSVGKSCIGIEGILNNTGLLFNIDAALYPVWKPNVFNVAGALTFDKVVEGLIGPANNGLSTGGTLTLTAQQWTDAMTDEAALRRHVGDKMAKSIKTGASQLEYESAAGVVKIVRHLFLKQGQAWFIPEEHAQRVGAQELSFKSPGSPNEWHFTEVSNTAASEIRLYGDFAPFIRQPNQCTLYTGIQSTADRLPA